MTSKRMTKECTNQCLCVKRGQSFPPGRLSETSACQVEKMTNNVYKTLPHVFVDSFQFKMIVRGCFFELVLSCELHDCEGGGYGNSATVYLQNVCFPSHVLVISNDFKWQNLARFSEEHD